MMNFGLQQCDLQQRPQWTKSSGGVLGVDLPVSMCFVDFGKVYNWIRTHVGCSLGWGSRTIRSWNDGRAESASLAQSGFSGCWTLSPILCVMLMDGMLRVRRSILPQNRIPGSWVDFLLSDWLPLIDRWVELLCSLLELCTLDDHTCDLFLTSSLLSKYTKTEKNPFYSDFTQIVIFRDYFPQRINPHSVPFWVFVNFD